MSHDVWLDRVAGFALGVDAPEERHALERHVALCTVCREHLTLYGRAVDELAGERERASHDLLGRIQARVERERLSPAAVDALRGVRHALDGEDGLHAACRVLNGHSDHRFTGIYRLAAPRLENVRLFDREDPRVEQAEPVRLSTTYCSLVLAAGRPFHTVDAPSDARLRHHPARDEVQAYCGVPLFTLEGRRWGTLCHFDVEPRTGAAEGAPLLLAASPAVMGRIADGGD